jgi:hypothetical protein
MAKMPILLFWTVILLATFSGCASWKYPDKVEKRYTSDEVPPTGRPFIMGELQDLSDRINFGKNGGVE